jgi:hypothetical protein
VVKVRKVRKFHRKLIPVAEDLTA